MISLKSLLKNMKEAQITSPKKGVETPLDAKVQIPGFGVMTRKQMQKSIQRYVEDIFNLSGDAGFGKHADNLNKYKLIKIK